MRQSIYILTIGLVVSLCVAYVANAQVPPTPTADIIAKGDSVPDDQEDVYYILSGEADQAIADGDYVTAAQRIIEAMETEPYNPSNLLLLSNLGTLYNYMDQDSLALATFNDVLRQAPSMTVVLENRGRLLLKMGDNQGAYQDFTAVIERDSCNVNARYYHGMMSLYGGDRYGAEQDFKVMEAESPDTYNTQVALASLYSMTGRDKEAIPYYKKLIEIDESAEFYAALAGCYLAIEDLTEASSTIEDGLRLWPNDPELYYYRAWLNRDRYRLKDAHDDANMAVKYGLDPKKAAALFGK